MDAELLPVVSWMEKAEAAVQQDTSQLSNYDLGCVISLILENPDFVTLQCPPSKIAKLVAYAVSTELSRRLKEERHDYED